MVDHQKNKRLIYALGETVLDLVSDGTDALKMVPGGSVLNASVSLGRMGSMVSLLSEFGTDKAGEYISNFLKKNCVDTNQCFRFPHHKTSLALAFLDEEKKASYSFYHDSPEHILEPSIPDITKEDILLFGSFYSVKPGRRDFIRSLLRKAVSAGATIYYDLNFRKDRTADLASLIPDYMENISAATIVKGSDEDFLNLFGMSDPDEIFRKVCNSGNILIITRGDKPLKVYTPAFSKTYAIPSIKPVSTIGAGDNFNAGFLYGLSETSFRAAELVNIPESAMDTMIGWGLAFATEACLSHENYISGKLEPETWKKYIV